MQNAESTEMKSVNATKNQNKKSSILQVLSSKISDAELMRYGKEQGFLFGHNLSIEQLKRTLRTHAFPVADFYEYLWVIEECSIERALAYSPAMRVFVSCVYIYCNKQKIWAHTMEAKYYAMALTAIIRGEHLNDWAGLFLEFLVTVRDELIPDEGYEDFFLHLSWLMIQRKIGLTTEKEFLNVLSLLQLKRYSSSELEYLCDSPSWQEDWSGLNAVIETRFGVTRSHFERIFGGSY